ncbi:lantibiotic dehydratase family protein [Streptomyces sp. KMM 9044]|uniref:lantibiotic dehydratase family protein n=1 Tax=Streptomyces sp. KMM 9044 TaxID=2744474 RepID=UPI002151AFE6|nr:lantibiotic dehydratase family protein [Streptomyces sp. KMM 9044]WAX78347.1 lantibiotic dehydratase family protein [Streptomyces sp. KMM 9044]
MSRTVSISPLLLTRVAGLPADALDLVASTTRKLLDELARTTAESGELATGIADIFFALVPQLEDDVPLRRKVLAGKRAVNRLDPLPWDDTVLDAVRRRLPGPEAVACLDAWVRLARERHDLLDQLGARLAEDRAEAVRHLHAALDVPGFAESVALAAPDWIRHSDRKERSARKLKTLYSYVIRAAVKTSPFSGLTTVGEAGTTGEGRARSRVSATPTYLALSRLARDERTAGRLRYRVAPIRRGTPTEPDGLLLHSEVVTTEGVVWRHDRAIEADHRARALAGFKAVDAEVQEAVALEELLVHLGGARPFARFRRLLDAGFIHPVPPWRRGDDPLPVLAALVAGKDAPITETDLVRAHDLGAHAHRKTVRNRIAAAGDLQTLTGGWSEHRDPGERKPSGLIYEDRETDLALSDPLAAPAVRADLTTLGERMRPYIFRSHLYDFLLDGFVAEYGPGGVCRDPLGFLMRLTVDRDANPPLERALYADIASRENPGDRAWLPVGPTSAPPNAGVFFQLEADSADDSATGRHQLVVNQFGAGSGALFTRFARLLGDGFRDRLTDHVQRSRAGVRCRELVVWTDCNTVQAECGGLLPPLVLPGEVGAPESLAPGALTLDDTVLVHDPATRTLSLFDRDGEPVGLAYLGLIPQHLLQSYVRLLAVLADPWVNGSPHSDYTLTQANRLRAHCGEEVVALPRVTDGPEGRLVTARASWIVPADALPEGQDDLELAVRWDEFRREHGMPEEVFVHQLGSGGFGLTQDRKPMWVSLGSPLSVGVLRHWLSPSTRHVRIVEALPARGRQPQRDHLGRPRVTEHAALLSWPKEYEEQ